MRDNIFNTPLLFIIYNRPEITFRTFEEIRKIRPKHLFIAADGPNKDKKEDINNCNKAREIVKLIDWPCKVKTKFLKENKGCALAVSSAIDWFFSNVDKGIILEDDCLPSKSFFIFCKELLKEYENDKEIMMISGTNFLGNWKSDKQKYHFSKVISLWGWATWRRAWKKYAHNLSFIESDIFKERLKDQLKSEWHYNYLLNKASLTKENKIDSWGYRWIMSFYKNKGIIIIPSKNLITNTGFSSNAAHTKNPFSWMSNLNKYELHPPFIKKAKIMIDNEFDNEIRSKMRNPVERFTNKLFSIFFK